MSEIVRETNQLIRNATKADIDRLRSEIILSDRQEKIFCMFFIKKLDCCFIADSLGVSQMVVYREINAIRKKIREATAMQENEKNLQGNRQK